MAATAHEQYKYPHTAMVMFVERGDSFSKKGRHRYLDE